MSTEGIKTDPKKIRHGVKVGPEPQEPGPLDLGPPQSLKLGSGTPLKFKSGTPGPLSKFKSGTPGPPSKFKSGTPSPFFNELISFQNISSFFIIVSFLQNKYQLCVNTSQVHLKMKKLSAETEAITFLGRHHLATLSVVYL